MPQPAAIRTPKETLKHFLSANGYAAMTPQARTAFLNQNLHTEQLRKAVLGNKILANKVTASNLTPKIETAKLEQQLLGIQRTTQVMELAAKRDKQNTTDRRFKTVGSVLDKLKTGFGKVTGKSEDGHAVSLGLLFLVLIILWATFASVKTKNGVSTTRIRLFGNVLMGNAQVTSS